MSRSAEPVCLGVVIGAHGVKGEVRIKSFTERPEDVAAYGPLGGGPDGARLKILRARPLKGGVVVAAIEGVGDRDRAEALKGVALTAPREALPELEAESYYHADLVGLAVEDGAGAALGRVKAVHNFGGGDLLEIARPDGKTAMLPFTRTVAPTVDLAAGRIVADPPDGWIDDGKESGDEQGDG